MKRVVITVKGDVQRVGYRDQVERIARKSEIFGFVENLKPHDVRIVCEGKEDAIKSFLEKINIKKQPVFVEHMNVLYEEPKNEFKWFEIQRGEPMEELGERMDLAGAVLYDVRDNQKETLGLQKETLGGISNLAILQKETLGGINSIDHKMDNIDSKYGKIAENMEKIFNEMKEERKDFRDSIEKLVKAIIESKK